jgi:hypothetical protein
LTESAGVKTLLVSKKPCYFLAAVLRSPIIKVIQHEMDPVWRHHRYGRHTLDSSGGYDKKKP